MKVVTASVMRELERRAGGFGLSPAVMMHLAGRAVAGEVARRLDRCGHPRALVLVGPGNNGGDGLICASNLSDWGTKVALYVWNRSVEGDGNYSLCLERGIESVFAADDVSFEKLRALLLSSDVVIDALLGTGISRPITGMLEGILQVVEEVRRKRQDPPEGPLRPFLASVDVPTGLNSDSGETDASCFTADLTVALGFPKIGCFLFPGAEKVGKLAIRGIGIPPRLADDVTIRLLGSEYVATLLPLRPLSAHKGTFGKVLVVGGSTNYIGAPCLASLAALRVGAGLVTLASAGSLLPILASKLTEPTFLPLPEIESGVLGPSAVGPVVDALGDYDVLLIGCGLGRHPETVRFVRETLKACPSGAKIVIDADGLNALAGVERWWEEVQAEVVLTPHAGEMARLSGRSVGDVSARRLDTVRQLAAEWGMTIALKGAHTFIASPEGEVNINPSANPALASAGTGDVLAGAIAGFMAQGLGAFQGASAGVYAHAGAGELLRRDLGDSGLLAGDLLGALPRVVKSIKET